MDKIKKTAKGIDIFVAVIQISVAISAVIMLAFMIVELVAPETVQNLSDTEGVVTEVSFGNVDVKLKNADAFIGDLGRFFALAAIPNFIKLVAMFVALIFIRRFLKPMKLGETPFAEGNYKNLFVVGWMTLITAIITGIINVICEQALYENFYFENIFNMDVVESVSVEYTLFSTAPIAVALVIFFFAYIFKYGEQLQKESDETL